MSNAYDEDGKMFDPNILAEEEMAYPLMNLLSPRANDAARQGNTRYYVAEGLFFLATQKMLNYLTVHPCGEESAEGATASPYGPSKWLSVFQLACQLCQNTKGDLVICALYSVTSELGRDWKDMNSASKFHWTEQTMQRLPEFMRQWEDLSEVFNRHVPSTYVEQVAHMITRLLWWTNARWHEDSVSAEDQLANNIESVGEVVFHPSLVSAAKACLDANYIWSCMWGDMEPNPKLAYSVEAELMIREMIAE